MSTEAWTDKHGDVWRLGPDGLMHTPETAPFPREYVEKKWGPLRPTAYCDEDPEEFCAHCLAGVNSSEHHEKCVATGHAEMGESA